MVAEGWIPSPVIFLSYTWQFLLLHGLVCMWDTMMVMCIITSDHRIHVVPNTIGEKLEVWAQPINTYLDHWIITSTCLIKAGILFLMKICSKHHRSKGLFSSCILAYGHWMNWESPRARLYYDSRFDIKTANHIREWMLGYYLKCHGRLLIAKVMTAFCFWSYHRPMMVMRLFLMTMAFCYTMFANHSVDIFDERFWKYIGYGNRYIVLLFDKTRQI